MDDVNATMQLVNVLLREFIAKLEDLRDMEAEQQKAEIERCIARYKEDLEG